MVTFHRWPTWIIASIYPFMLLLLSHAIEARSQVVTASRPLIPFNVDEIRTVTDWGDSVYAVTGSGVVVAFDTLFSSSRVLDEISNLRAGRLWVYDGDLFVEDPTVGVYVCLRNGSRQFLSLSNGNLKIGFNISMQPLFVTDRGTFTLVRSDEGYWNVRPFEIQVPYHSDIGQLVYTQECVFVSRHAKRAVRYRADGSMDTTSLVLGSNQMIHMFDDTTHVITEPGPIVVGTNLCSNSSVYYGIRYGLDSLLTMNGSTMRTTTRAPFVVFHGNYRKGTSQMIVWRSGTVLDTSYNALVPERQWHASTTERAIYLFGMDGWIRRVSLTARSVTTRPTLLCDGCSIAAERASLYSKDNSYSYLERTSQGRLRPFIIERDTIRDLSLEDERFAGLRSSMDLQHYHRFPNGAEVYQYATGFAYRQRGAQWQFRPLELAGVSQTVDSSTVIIAPVMIRYRPEVDSVVIQNINGRAIWSGPHGATEKHIVFTNRNFDVIRRDDWRDSVEFESIPVSASFAGLSRGRCVLTRAFQNNQDPNIHGSLRVFYVGVEDKSIDSITVRLSDPLPLDVRALVVHDTLRLISQSRSVYASVSENGNASFRDLKRGPLVSRLIGAVALFEIHDSSTVIARFRDSRREYVVRTGSLDSTVSVEAVDALDVAFQHIFMMNVYPNPGTTTATLEMRRHGSSGTSATELFLVDMLGNRVRDYSTSADFMFTVGTIGRATLDYAGIPSGQYLLVMRNSGVTTSKLVSISR